MLHYNRIYCGLSVSGQQGIWYSVWKVGIGIVEQLYHFYGQLVLYCIQGKSCTPVACIDNNLKRFYLFWIKEFFQMIYISAHYIIMDDIPGFKAANIKIIIEYHSFYLVKSRIVSNR